MPPLSKQKRASKERSRITGGKYDAKKVYKNNNSIKKTIKKNNFDLRNDETASSEFFNEDEDWGDDDDSGWDDPEDMEVETRIHQRLKGIDLVWRNDNKLERTKRGPYKIGKIPKSTFYDKYGPNGSLTKASAGTEKITKFFKISDNQTNNLQSPNSDTLEDTSSDSESEIVNPYTCQLTEKINNLKEELEKQYNQLTVIEYNYKRAIFEYLTGLNSNNGCGRMDISLEVVQRIFINGDV